MPQIIEQSLFLFPTKCGAGCTSDDACKKCFPAEYSDRAKCDDKQCVINLGAPIQLAPIVSKVVPMVNTAYHTLKSKNGFFNIGIYFKLQCGTGCNNDADCERCDRDKVGFKCLDVGGGEKKCGVRSKVVQPSK